MEEKEYCSICGCELGEHEGFVVGNELLCQDCVDEHCTVCDHCGVVNWESDSVQDDDICLCHPCFIDNYRRCECCDRIIRDSNTNWHNDIAYCNSCFADLDDDDEIEDYSYKPEPIFYGKGKRFLGVELEVDEGYKDNDNAHKLKDIGNDRAEHIYNKSDGSLDDGFEIVSYPMSLDYHMEEMNWESILHEAVQMGYRSHMTSTCGLHVHVNRNAFGDNQAEQEEVIGKILFLVEKHWAEIFCFSRRSACNMTRWSARYGYEKTGKEILKKAKDSRNGRYCAVNLCNYHTIEFRLFRGALKYNTFIATLQFVDSICRVAISMSQQELEDLSWSEFVSHIEYPELVQYLKERRLYVNDGIFAEEDF